MYAGHTMPKPLTECHFNLDYTTHALGGYSRESNSSRKLPWSGVPDGEYLVQVMTANCPVAPSKSSL